MDTTIAVVFLTTFIAYSTCLPNPLDITNDFGKEAERFSNKLEDKKDNKVDTIDADNALHFRLENKYKSWYLDEERAKTVARTFGSHKALFRRKRWTIKAIWGEEEEEEESETRREVSHCQATCWAGWQRWGPCTSNCGNGGFRTRTREALPYKNCRCPGDYIGIEPCNRRCFNGGTAASEDSCSCPPGFSGTCCENKITCGDPGVPRNGIATPYGNSHDYDTVVRYSCNEGYTLAGRVNTRRCTENGRWTSTTPVCQRIRCRHPGAPRFGKATSSSVVEYESIIQFSCDLGYFLRGSETSICQADGSWSDPLPTCAKGGCGDPGTPAHCRMIGSDFSFDNVVRFECNEGYVLVGSEERRCQADGQWSCVQPKCLTADSLLKKCPLLEEIENGEVVTTQGYLYQSIAEYSCIEGYYLDGHQHRACQVNEEWSGRKPGCKPILCEPLTAPLHGEVDQPEGLVPFGSKATFSCSHGHGLEGDSERICGGTGLVGIWSGVQPSCQAISCGAPTAPSNGRIVGYSYNYEDNVTVECGPGFYLQGSHQLSCTRDSSWVGNTDDNPICIECPLNEYSSSISSSTTCMSCPDNSETDQTGSSDVRQCLCKEGYHQETDDSPCEAIVCDLPPVLPGITVIGTCDIGYGGACRFDCQNGYVRFVGNFYRTCSGTGQWTGEPLQCAPCPKDTYKMDSVSCATCPPNSETQGVNSSRTDCLPMAGFEFGADNLILDVNECLDDSTNPCADKDKCVNTAGSAHCDCPPGSIQASMFEGSKSLTSCIVEVSGCPSLTAPLNGALNCNKTGDVETCMVQCDMDYEFMTPDNTYEVRCGPDTGFAWSHTLDGQTLPECVATVFGDPSLNGLVSYPEVDCAELTQNEKQDAVNTFVDLAESEGVCYKNAGYICEVMKADTVCATEEEDAVLKFDRRKRDLEGPTAFNMVSFNFTFKLDPYFHKDNHACDDLLCREKYRTLLEFSSWKTTETLKHLIDNCDLCIVSDDGSTLQAQLRIEQNIQINCPPGAAPKQYHCVCLPGLRYDRERNLCESNDAGTDADDETNDSEELTSDTDCPYEPNPCTEENINLGFTNFAHEDEDKYVECNPANIGQCRISSCEEGYFYSVEHRACIWRE